MSQAPQTLCAREIIESNVMDEIDIWRSAHLLIKQHGPDAGFHAALRADELLAQGDNDGFHAWARIGRAIRDLERQQPVDHECLN